MSTSDRYREICRDVAEFESRFGPEEKADTAVRAIGKAGECLQEWLEQVGDIPRMHLEHKLTPVLLKAHNNLDRGRLLFEESGQEDLAAATWGLQQKIYRLLNDL